MLQRLFRKFDLVVYFLFTFAFMCAGAAISYGFGLRLFSPEHLDLLSLVVWILMVFSPTIAAVLVTAVNEGTKG
ncbi:MAG TPA: hypothetical protein VLH81_07440, partial [Desulfobacterales bacterium]|nr:hypothetical protein [Desulfobacterales bacterium]